MKVRLQNGDFYEEVIRIVKYWGNYTLVFKDNKRMAVAIPFEAIAIVEE